MLQFVSFLNYYFIHKFGIIQVHKELNKLKSAQQKLIEDQKILQKLHEQLNAEYDSLSEERETLKISLRDTRAEKRNLQDKYSQLNIACTALEAEKENLLKDSQSLINLRTEHSKLKVTSIFSILVNVFVYIVSLFFLFFFEKRNF